MITEQLREPAPHSNQVIGAERYLRERWQPKFRDLSFLTLSDLLKVVKNTAPKIQGIIFDYGSGGAPYRECFRDCSAYIRADLLASPFVDRVLTAEGLTTERSGEYDGVLSFQVLEHVPDPDRYVEECARILKAGGHLLLTTHGLFPEHKCPDDFSRWTPQGLEKLLHLNGFEVIESYKLTCGWRAGIQLLHYILEEVRHREDSPVPFVLRVVRKLYMLLALPLLNLLGNFFNQKKAIVPAEARESIYLGVAFLARKV